MATMIDVRAQWDAADVDEMDQMTDEAEEIARNPNAEDLDPATLVWALRVLALRIEHMEEVDDA
jgi:hypothetical protein